MATIPTIEPQTLALGDTVKWNRDDLSDYPAPTWTLTYWLYNATKSYSVVATANGVNHSVVITAATSAAYVAGTYTWKAFVTTGSGSTAERYEVDSGTFIIQANPAILVSNAGLDDRSHVKKVLDAIRAVIEDRASKDQESFSIAGRSLSRTSIDDLLKFERKYTALYAAELRDKKLARGERPGGRILIGFNS